MKLDDLPAPRLFVLEQILKRNVETMASLAKMLNVRLRPHIKTHNLKTLYDIQSKVGISGVTVATLAEAANAISWECRDIFIAREAMDRASLDFVADLMASNDRPDISIAVDSEDGVSLINEVMTKRNQKVSVRIEIDSGGGRCGLFDKDKILKLARKIVEAKLNLDGIFTHEGHVYKSGSLDAMHSDSRNVVSKMRSISEHLSCNGINVRNISIGSSPSVKLLDEAEGITEIRPGNYVFNDLIQVANGTAKVEDCSLRISAVVISKSSSGGAILNFGSKLIGGDTVKIEGTQAYAMTISPENFYVTRIYEEHAVIESPSAFYIGQELTLIPAHACMAANIAKQISIVDLQNVIVTTLSRPVQICESAK